MNKISKSLNQITPFNIYHFLPKIHKNQKTNLSIKIIKKNHLNHNLNIQPNQNNFQKLISTHNLKNQHKNTNKSYLSNISLKLL